MNLEHLDALRSRLARERERLALSKTPHESALRQVYVNQCEREIEGEMRFLGLASVSNSISDDDLLAELTKP